MTVRIKRAALGVTATVPDGAEDGYFEALVAVFGNVDSDGDVVDPGAFADTIAEWNTKGLPIPVIWSHRWEDPFCHIGGATAEETAKGLLIRGNLDLTNPTAAQVYKLLKSGRISQFSFVAFCPDGGWTLESLEDGSVVCHLQKLDLVEVGPCLRGVNTMTALQSIKSDLDLVLRSQTPGIEAPQLDELRAVQDQFAAALDGEPTPSSPTGDAPEEPERPASASPSARAKAIATLIERSPHGPAE